MGFAARFLLLWVALLASPASAVAQSDELTIERVWTQDGGGTDTSSFQPGDGIRYAGLVRNPSSILIATTTITLTARGPLSNCCAEIFSYIEQYEDIPPGLVGFYRPSTIPSNAQNGEYEFTLSVDDARGQHISGTSRFTITGGVEPPAPPPPPPPPPEPDPPAPPPEPGPAPLTLDHAYPYIDAHISHDSFRPGDDISFFIQVHNTSDHALDVSATVVIRGPTTDCCRSAPVVYNTTLHRDGLFAWQPGYSTSWNFDDIFGSTRAPEGAYEVSWTVDTDGFSLSGTYTFTVAGRTPPEPDPPPPDDPPVDISSFPDGRADNLIVLVHGCCTTPGHVTNEWHKLGENVADRLLQDGQPSSKWEIVVWDWSAFTKPPTLLRPRPLVAKDAYDAAERVGKRLAKLIARNNYKYVHLIAHSAGSKLIDKVAIDLVSDSIRTGRKPFIHLTFLDAYTPEHDELSYGGLADYAEHYVDKSRGLVFTDSDLVYAFNFDLTDWIFDNGERDLTGHKWPLIWYTRGIEFSGYGGLFGYALSKEGGNRQVRRLADKFPSGDSCKLTHALTQC